jgi:hypothetical protein
MAGSNNSSSIRTKELKKGKLMTMTYVPTWERNYDKWDTEPDVYDSILDEELENEKVDGELSIEDVDDSEIAFDEDFDL